METVVITITRQMDGVNFGLSPIVLKEIKETFPNSEPIRKIFIAFDQKENDLQPLFEKIKKHFLPALIGVENKQELKKIKHLRFYDPSRRIPETILHIN